MKKYWWHDAIVYQIYPKSFMDSNGDGCGDIRGIISKLDYLADLGINTIWLCPFYPSPLADQGYDISDYYGVDPRFGTIEDIDDLFKESKKRDIKVILDLVANHCSDEHEWFIKALKDPTGTYGEYFYLEKGKNTPTNMRSYFGNSVWDKLGDTDFFYLHFFHKKQPDLNWENEELRNEIYKNIKWWLNRGAAGFRVDAITNIKKKLPFKSYPADRADGTCSIDAMMKEVTGIEEFLTELRDKGFGGKDVFTVGEVFDTGTGGIDSWIGENGYFSSIFDFGGVAFDGGKYWFERRKITPEHYKETVFNAQKESFKNNVLFSNVIENHDCPRSPNFFLKQGHINNYSKKALAGIYFLLRGIPFIYQGQEIGMENTSFNSPSDFLDCAAEGEYQRAVADGVLPKKAFEVASSMTRDNARTPMQWTDEINAGFSSGTPWINVNANFKEINTKNQLGDKESLYYFYKKLIDLRKNAEYNETLVYGETVPFLPELTDFFAYFRVGEPTLLIAANFTDSSKEVPFNVKYNFKILINNYNEFEFNKDKAMFLPYQIIVAEV
jgi:oligo-1,6-glucosidase